MTLKNYTTGISVEKTMMEIEKTLSQHGATHIFKQYDHNGNPRALAFMADVQGELIKFMLPMEEDKIQVIFKNAVSKGKMPRRYFNDIEQARRTGWRIIKDWVASQMALIEINVAKFEEIFLPYMYDEKTQQTLFQKFENRGFNLQIEDKTKIKGDGE